MVRKRGGGCLKSDETSSGVETSDELGLRAEMANHKHRVNILTLKNGSGSIKLLLLYYYHHHLVLSSIIQNYCIASEIHLNILNDRKLVLKILQ